MTEISQCVTSLGPESWGKHRVQVVLGLPPLPTWQCRDCDEAFFWAPDLMAKWRIILQNALFEANGELAEE